MNRKIAYKILQGEKEKEPKGGGKGGGGGCLTRAALFPFPPHLQFVTCKFVDHIVRLLQKLQKFTYRLIRPRQTYLVFILNLVKPLVTLIFWMRRLLRRGEKEKEPQEPSFLILSDKFLINSSGFSHFRSRRCRVCWKTGGSSDSWW